MRSLLVFIFMLMFMSVGAQAQTRALPVNFTVEAGVADVQTETGFSTAPTIAGSLWATNSVGYVGVRAAGILPLRDVEGKPYDLRDYGTLAPEIGVLPGSGDVLLGAGYRFGFASQPYGFVSLGEPFNLERTNLRLEASRDLVSLTVGVSY